MNEVTRGMETLSELKGKRVLLMCSAFYYWGCVVSVGLEHLALDDCYIVYQTGDWSRNCEWEEAQKLPMQPWYVRRNAIESFGVCDEPGGGAR